MIWLLIILVKGPLDREDTLIHGAAQSLEQTNSQI